MQKQQDGNGRLGKVGVIVAVVASMLSATGAIGSYYWAAGGVCSRVDRLEEDVAALKTREEKQDDCINEIGKSLSGMEADLRWIRKFMEKMQSVQAASSTNPDAGA